MALNRLKLLVLNKKYVGLLLGVAMFLAFTGGGAAADESLAASLNTALSQPSKNKSKVSAVVVDVHTGDTLYANRYANDGFIPASNMKLVTSAVALHTYGPEAKFTTTLAVAGDDLLVIGTGDPAFGDAKLAERDGRTPMSVLDDWAMALRNAGIVKIKGDLVVIDTVFDDKLVHPTWSSNNRLQWYGAPVAGVSFNSNCVDFTFVPTSAGKSATILTVPAEGGFVVQGSVKTVGKDGKHNPVLGKRPAPEKGMSVYTVRGNLKQRSGPHPKPVDDPRLFLGEVLKAHFARHGIEIAGHVRLEERVTSEMAQRSRVIATHQTALPDILGRVNTDSQNMMAEALAKLNGWAYELRQGNLRDRGTWIGGHAAAIAFLKSQGIDTVSVVSADGSGLSRDNRVSAAVLARLLETMLRDHEHSEYYLDSLAVSGVRGSFRKRLKSLTGRVFAKTGTINGVSSLSGYVFADNGRIAAFSILHNGPAGGFRQQQDRAVQAISDWLNDQPGVAIEDPDVVEAMRHVGLLAEPVAQ
ncbi:D-alanyl-D-alanine carboxypeptidase/D-alanyl-D-alanine endopeptidase [Algisphaera agarilytica]|uniref:D-alanyl-D-alanine carboxypeptidase/D-alanyl-D-alanine-endopeptidase (Penicillin-binding protein 4) n=1 Tax=Algisphaera agarilytica TaxID=1385975 RepID=A0A7X0H9W0_9BACT|nr:D-alanyl-D-alanine carboxypeptidase/D-alanyl-D-alanine-endopeptidase [Algisphaera agarilytica]MBB6430851.1 D-alanyl-D-alanine carboxypeptidase/D-alanyl-D-alanine-endopeptidase (penicillin-binding protein 4) [Algisphaera agarilytica]